MHIRFGTDGWRAVIAADFTFENVARVTRGVVEWLKEQGGVQGGLVVGYDRRFLSREFAECAAETAAGSGVDAFLFDRPAPTPVVSWQVRERRAAAGIMITASHNPPQYNGLKVKESFGGPARPHSTRRIEELVAAGAGKALSASRGRVTRFDPRPSYLAQLSSLVDLEGIRRSGVRVACDPMHGAAAGWLGELLPGMTEIHGEENPGFGGQPPEPTAESLRELGELVRVGGFSAGLAFDGDADRIGAVDGDGEFFSPHAIFAVALRHLHEERGLRGGVVKSVSSSVMIDLLCERYGLPLHETPIGFKHLGELMLRHDILIGGEESGGLGVKGHLPERDGILMGLILLEAMARSGKGLGELLAECRRHTGEFFYRRIDLPADAGTAERLRASLAPGRVLEVAGKRVLGGNFLDGFKYLLEDRSWLLIRPSGTEPLLRLYAEGCSMAEVEELLAAGRRLAE
ncbi:MAG TPA: phosphoglucomutase/phosphomannomutase family protein [Verrucomicrobiae bacterium]|nr:phosphoglucomutase/phosphomannomutase family protein [Verrucomicrobiae bacterium]